MMSQTGQQIIARKILPRFSRSKGNQAITFGQIWSNYADNELEGLVPDLFFPFCLI